MPLLPATLAVDLKAVYDEIKAIPDSETALIALAAKQAAAIDKYIRTATITVNPSTFQVTIT